MLEYAIVGVDFAPATDQLVRGLWRLDPLGLRRIVLVHVLGGRYPQGPEERHRDHYERRLAEVSRTIGDGFDVSAQLRSGDVSTELQRAADEAEADVIIAGSRGHTPWRDLFLGSTVLDLLRTSARPILLLPLGPVPTRTMEAADGGGIVLATDGSPSAREAERVARDLAGRAGGVAVTVLEVAVPAPDQPHEARDRALGHLEALAGAGLETCVVYGPLPEEIARIAAERSADLIVVGARGHNPLTGLLLGSTAEHLLRTAGRPVLLVRGNGVSA